MTNALIKKGFDDFPSLFSRHWMDSIFPTDLDKMFESPRAIFPYDIVDHTDEKGNVTSTELVFALGGISKNDINIKVVGDTLSVDINKSEKEEKNKVVRHKGISRRSMSIDYGLYGVDKENIKAKLKDGELKITLPRSEVNESVVKIED